MGDSMAGVSDIDFLELKRRGVRALVFDKDNTLTNPYTNELHPTAVLAIQEVRKHFGPNGAVVFSNSLGDVADKKNDYAAAKKTEAALGLPILKHDQQVRLTTSNCYVILFTMIPI